MYTVLIVCECFPMLEGISIDGDNPDHIVWIYEKTLERADEFGIQGVTYRLTQGKYRPGGMYSYRLTHGEMRYRVSRTDSLRVSPGHVACTAIDSLMVR